MSEIKIISEAGFLIPLSQITKETVESAKKAFHRRFYIESKCKKCPYLEDRHSENCDNCEGFVGARATAKTVVHKGKEYLSIPRGCRDKAIKIASKDPNVSSVRVVSGHKANQEMKRKISLLESCQMRPYQLEAVQAIFDHRRGIIKSPPRSGKTLIGAAFACEAGLKTIILAHQREWLSNFKETFLGSATQQGFTDATPSQIGFARNLKDFEKYDVCLCTFNQFFSEKGKGILSQIRSMFGVLIGDEIHKTPALATSRVLAQFNARYVVGLTGTPARKITDEIKIAHDLVGPIIYTSKVEQLRPKVLLLDTPGKYEYNTRAGKAALTSLQSKLENNKARKMKIIKFAINQARSGHLVMIPLTRVQSILEWTRAINELVERKAYAVPFYGGLPKDIRPRVIERLRQFKSRIVVGNIGMLSTGLNIPRASMLIDCCVTSNIPNSEQRFARILTPLEDKPQPVVVFTMDDCDFMRKCRRNEFWNSLIPVYNPIVSSDIKSRLMEYFSGGESSGKADFFKDR